MGFCAAVGLYSARFQPCVPQAPFEARSMIVKCGNCQTRFKIPDDKVTDKGVKVRCTKCQNTFRVTKADAQPPLAAAAPGADADPFAKFGPSPDPIHGQDTRPFTLPPDLAAMQPKVTAGSGLSPSFEAQADLPREAFDSPTRIGPPPTAPANRKNAMPGAGPPPRTSSSSGLAPSAFDPMAGSTPSKQPSAFDPFDFGSAAPAAPSAPAMDPFDFGGNPEGPTKVQQKLNVAEAMPPTPAFDFDSLTAAPPPPAAPDPFADVPTKPQGAVAADPFAFPDEATHTAVVPPQSKGGMLDDVPPPAHSDPFANAPGDEGLSSVNLGSPDARAMFDMPSKPAAAAPSSEAPSVPLAAIKLQKMPASEVGSPQTPTVPGADIAGDAKKPGAARRISGVIMNLAIAAVIFVALFATLLVYLNEGKVELASFQPNRLSAMLLSNANWTAGDISNGLYDTRGGKPVFFVRGEVRNKGAKASRVKVRAEILDGNTVIRSSEVFVGAAPTPEDLYSLGSSADVDALNARLQKSSTEVQPGQTAPFLVTFYEFPPDLSPYRLKVTVVEGGTVPETAAR